MPGVVVNNTSMQSPAKGPTIIDNGVGVECSIYGLGIIKNSFDNDSNRYECIKITSLNTKLSVECDYIEGLGGTSPDTIQGPCISALGSKFHLKCNKIFNMNNGAVIIGSFSNVVSDINLKIAQIITGLEDTPNTGTTAVILFGNGFVKVDQIICRNLGHCFSVRAGSILAFIKKCINFRNRSNVVSTIHVPKPNQGSDTQKLVLYFDEILSLHGTNTNDFSGVAIDLSGGTGIFIGRRVFSTDAFGIEINGVNAKGYIKCDEVISEKYSAIGLNLFTNQITLDINYVEGNNSDGDGGAIFSFDAANFVMKNATIKNKNTGSSAKGMGLFRNGATGPMPIVELNNLKIISNGAVIFYNSSPAINIKNYGLFGTIVPGTNVSLKIGPKPGETGYNYQCIIDPDLN